ncbi:nucleotidyltransferase family protein [Oryzomonas rubra]|uniref:CBS domain-containing protein n=1 Tax=Oryzomonas rubra TaxID=2509454 RepID=A0A5A9XC30_9BACT|nr:nucleotidyltransferase family protein [Oryzomonas rubra]KAA0890490.1 CBS domain-containing protein [Oryzomonas rubra]
MITTLMIRNGSRIKDALLQLEETERRTLFVVDGEERLIGTLTDGDIRRWILAEGSLDGTVESICNTMPCLTTAGYDLEQIKTTMLEKRIGCIPVVNGKREIIEVLLWENVFGEVQAGRQLTPIRLPVVIMAGGKGTRLDPFTKILPKPLIPLGDKTVIETIIDSFVVCGVDKFYISVNYKSKIIKSYFEELGPAYTIEYIYEDKPLGTAGSLRYLSGKIDTPLIVTNCDVIIKADYSDVVKHHLTNDNDITLVASLKNYNIPYGVCEVENGGILSRIREKPEYNFLVNTGLYVVKPETLSFIPENEFFHFTHLIEKVKESGGKVGIYPVSEKSWIDVGEWAEYKKALDTLHLNF